MNSCINIFAVLFLLFSVNGHAVHDSSICVESFMNAPAAVSCKLLNAKLLDEQGTCELITECASRFAQEMTNINSIEAHASDVSKLINLRGHLMIETR
jgi:hypothetical protein